MGYTPPVAIYALDFSGTRYAGLQVKIREQSLGDLLSTLDAAAAADMNSPTAEDAHAVKKVFTDLADNIVSWNVEEDDGTPVPATLEGLRRYGTSFANAIVQAWRQAMSEVDAPLGSGSSSGGTPDLTLMPMAPLSSESLAS